MKRIFLAGLLLAVAGGGIAVALTLTNQSGQTSKPTEPDSAIATRLLQNQKKLGLCQDSFDQAQAEQGTIAYPVDEQTYFVTVQCFLAAYQGNYEFWAYTPATETAKHLTVTEFTQNAQQQWEKVESPSIGGIPKFDPEQRVLTVQTKYRGAGDCGSIGTYKFETNALQLVEFKAKAACDGNTKPWETVFP